MEEKKILVVEDDRDTSELYKLLLEDILHSGVDVAHDGREALSLFEARPEKYPVVILDVLLPDSSGLEVFKKIRALSNQVKIGIISCVTDRIQDPGSAFSFQKPFDVDEFKSAISLHFPLPVA